MNRITSVTVLVLFAFATPFPARASSLLPITNTRHIQISSAIFRGTVVDAQSYEDPADSRIYTRTVVRVDEVFKGRLPSLVRLVHRGGTVGDRGELGGFAPQFTVGEERLLFVSRRADGTLYATRGGASALKLPGAAADPVAWPFAAGQALLKDLRGQTTESPLSGGDLTDQAADPQLLAAQAKPSGPVPMGSPSSSATNLLVGSDSIPARFLLPDRGEPIPYLIDADYLPTGITQTQAVNAVQTALAAWTNATSLRYRFAGIQSFGVAAANVNASDGFLRIQLHDHYNYIGGGPGGDVLGEGGQAWTILTLSPGWTTGGNVVGNDFHKAVVGYIVLQHTNVVMQNLSTFTEVLGHEIGHTIGLAHSSESFSEPNPILKQAIMYYMVHADGRGATLNSFDTNTSRQVHPPNNTPPYCYDRFMDVISSPIRPINVPGVNTVQLRGYDLQNSALALATTDATTNNGTFSVLNSNITYVPNGLYNDSGRIDPTSGNYYEIIYGRYSDGVNASPYATIRVLSYYKDSYSEGIPDSWRLSYFGNANPSVGLKHHAADDADGDGFSNLTEYLFGSNPTNAASNLRITSFDSSTLQWQAKGYEVYELLSSTNFTRWTRALNPQVPTNSIGTATGFTHGRPSEFYRIVKLP